ncbi:hypothetical protein N656DRAFT_351486 [Canariomyces notabilis]|uniref:NACHT domain-containing protein n=1 Tax=Canariomyces notabilis TaxID=2074819 RepID=A0AAN6QM11_9PEZI|nr:hypothetical protein N656DRAFT_351486 [Canariomyces arenarius]
MASMTSNVASGFRLEGHARLQVGNNINVYSAGRDCLADLRSQCVDPSDVKNRIEFLKGGLLKASYEWVLPEFWSWHGNSLSRLFWIRGDAGKGKTMLVCGIIDDLKARGHGDLIAYFFCQASDSRLQSSTMVLKSLLFSLLARPRYGHLRKHLEVKHNSAGKQMFDDSNNTTFFGLRDVLENMMRDNEFLPTCLIVDGLDECENGLGEVLHLIRNTATTCDRIRWVVSSRNWPPIERQLGSLNFAITLNLEKNAENVSQAISHYLDHKVPQLDCIRDNTALQRETKSRLQEKANGTFLWVSLVLKQLETECFLESAVLPLIEDIPPGLWPIFERMMSKLKENRVYFEACRGVLSTATLTNRPLQLQELQFLADVNKTDNISKVVNLCGSFLTSVDGTVSLIHQSAKDYLLDPQRALAEAFPEGLAGVHHRTFVRPLEFMNSTLRRDIYGLRRQDCSVQEIQTPSPDPLSQGRYLYLHVLDRSSH